MNRQDAQKAIMDEVKELLADSEYKKIESLVPRLTSKHRLEDIIIKGVKKAIEEASEAQLGLAVQFAENSARIRKMNKEVRHGCGND